MVKPKNKSKKRNVKANTAASEVQPTSRPNATNNRTKSVNETTQTVDKSNSKVNLSATLICIYCGNNDEGEEWFVQCDKCDNHIHFKCAGIEEIAEEESWFCKSCVSSQNETQENEHGNASKENENNAPIVTQHSQANGTETVNLSATEQAPKENRGITSTRNPTVKAHSDVSHAKSGSSTSSSRRKESELQRLEEEFKIQAECDAAALALKLEAINVRAAREKAYIKEKQKVLDDASDKSCGEHKTEKSAFISQWVLEQRSHNRPERAKSLDDQRIRASQRFNDKIDSLNLDVSIPVYGHEITKIHSSRKTNTKPILERTSYTAQEIKDFLEWKQRRDLDERVKSQPLRENKTLLPISQDVRLEDLYEDDELQNGRSYTNVDHFAPPITKSTMIQTFARENRVTTENSAVTSPRTPYQANVSTTGLVYTQQHGLPLPTSDRETVFSSDRPIMSTRINVTNQNENGRFGVDDIQVPSKISVNHVIFPESTSNSINDHRDQACSYAAASQNNQLKITSQADLDHGNGYYDQLYSYHTNTSSSMGKDRFNQNSRNDNNHVQSAQANMSNASQLQSKGLTTSQIAARHALPKDLPRFSGNPKDWLRFIKRYNNSTMMCGYTDDENLERLDKCLEGQAYTLVESLLLMPDSVSEIIDTLKEKYGRPELIIKSTLKSIRDFPLIKPDRLDLLSDFGYVVRNGCKQIEDLGLHNYLIDPGLLQDIVDKLPASTKIEWADHVEVFGVAHVNLKTMANWLHQLSKRINRILPTETKTDSKHDSKSSSDEKKKSNSSKSGFVHVHDNDKSKSSSSGDRKLKCPICDRECSSLENCSKFNGFDVDQRWKSIKDKKLCRKCLKYHRRNCFISKNCGVNGCEFKHHSMLHNEQRHSKNPNMSSDSNRNNSSQSNNTNSKSVVTGSSNTHYAEGGELFRIVPVKLYANDRTVSTFAFLDEGSHFTLMERQIANELELSGAPETICMLWTKKVHRQEATEVVNFEISGIDNGTETTKYPIKAVNVVEDLNLPEQSLDIEQLKSKFKHLQNLPIQGYKKAIPTLLIGVKHAKLAVPVKSVEGNDDEPIATKSRLGWTVHGTTSNSTKGYINTHGVSRCPCHDRDEEIHKQMKDHFTVENFGVVASNASLDSKENVRALSMLEKLTLRKGNRFETGLLWKNDEYQLPESFGMAMKRLQCLEKKGSSVIKVIDDAIADYVRKGYVHKLCPEELAEDHKRIWYLPIFTVFHPKKPEKLRTVFDAAAKVKGISLNSALHSGPDLVPSIVDVLRRFRENKIAIAGDIKEMYHQVMVNGEDKHAQRFIWRNGDSTREPDIYVMDVLTFGSKSSPVSAQFVKNLNAEEYESEYPRAAIAIKRNTYVDDLLDGAKGVKEAIQLIEDVKFVHRQGGFEIRNFKSNSEEVLEAVGENIQPERIPVDDTSIERVLGMFWDMKSDCFTFSLKYTKIAEDILTKRRVPTKRELLKMLMSVFDPLGLLQYYLVHLKIIIQNTWKSGVKWDDALPNNLIEMWHRWFQLLPEVEKLSVPRWHFSEILEDETEIELHVFVDASDHAYASVAYLRFRTKFGYKCSLVGSKTRVSPLKYMSTTRKELMAALLGTRFSNSVRESLTSNIKRRIFWSDSSTVLIWLRSDHQKYSQFVGHRVGEILESTELPEWRWVPSKMNAADEATKWLKNPSFVQSSQWFTGPQFMYDEESEWPQQTSKLIPNGTNEEMKLSCIHSGIIMPAIVNAANFSKWERAVRGLAFAIRWGRKLLAKVRKLPFSSEPLTQAELLQSERLLFSQAQWEGFTEEMVALKRNLQRPKKPAKISKSSAIHDCTPFLDEYGIMRVEGRLDKATALSIDAKHPIIMPRNHPLTKLLIMSYHRKFLHKNYETAINDMRQRFYVPRARVAFKSARWSCMLCKVKNCRPKIPKMAALPAVRFEPGIRPFTYTGVDYFGPMEVMIRRRSEKRWGVLFTCLTIRAIHIEVVSSLDTGACIKAIRDFINVRGKPTEFFSDNGTNFVGANNALKEELKKLNEKELAESVTSCYTKWNFNPPASPHMGGCWERLVQTVKSCLEQSMITRTPQVDDLRSLLLEAMNIVNARPLTYIPVDSFESEALTPNHFLLGSSNGIKPPGNFRNDGPYLRQVWKEIQRCADIFWDRFIKEYAPTLTRSTKWFDSVKPIEVGDIVIDINENKPRNVYPKARVVEAPIGSKSQVRKARIQYADGSTLWRPARRLAVLDLQRPETSEAPTNEDGLDLSPTNETGGNSVGAKSSIIQPKSSGGSTVRRTD